MDADGCEDAMKAVEKVLSGAVNKVLSKFKASTESNTSGRSSRTSKPRSRASDSRNTLTELSTSTARSKPKSRAESEIHPTLTTFGCRHTSVRKGE